MNHDLADTLQQLESKLRSADTLAVVGRVQSAQGTLIRASGVRARVGELCRLQDPASGATLDAEVVGLANGQVLLTPLGHLQGLSSETLVYATGRSQTFPAGPALLGRVLDANGTPLDGKAAPQAECEVPLYNDPPSPLTRQPVDKPFATGIRVIDSLLTCGEGQRLGIFAAAGGGKSTTLGMLARGSAADVNVIALVGERGREVGEFLNDALGEQGLARSVVIVATSDRPALERARATYAATAVAEYFRDRGQRVLLMIDSVTRFARALRDVGLAVGEPPTRRGFPPSVFSALPQVFERAGNGARGSITAFYSVLMDDDDQSDPVAEETRSILDGHIYLSRKLGNANHYPAVDVLASASRLFTRLAPPEHRHDAGHARRLLAKYQAIELLVQLGEYQPGSDAEADEAIARRPALLAHLRQHAEQPVSYADSLASLREALS